MTPAKRVLWTLAINRSSRRLRRSCRRAISFRPWRHRNRLSGRDGGFGDGDPGAGPTSIADAIASLRADCESRFQLALRPSTRFCSEPRRLNFLGPLQFASAAASAAFHARPSVTRFSGEWPRADWTSASAGSIPGFGSFATSARNRRILRFDDLTTFEQFGDVDRRERFARPGRITMSASTSRQKPLALARNFGPVVRVHGRGLRLVVRRPGSDVTSTVFTRDSVALRLPASREPDRS